MSTEPVRIKVEASALDHMINFHGGDIETPQGPLTGAKRLSDTSDTIVILFDRLQLWCKPTDRITIFEGAFHERRTR